VYDTATASLIAETESMTALSGMLFLRFSAVDYIFKEIPKMLTFKVKTIINTPGDSFDPGKIVQFPIYLKLS
jgi:hypothetical protein